MNYYYYLWYRTQGVAPDNLLSGLPPSMRSTLCQTMYSPMIHAALDTKNFNEESHGFFRIISEYIQSQLLLQNMIVCRLVYVLLYSLQVLKSRKLGKIQLKNWGKTHAELETCM